MDKLKEKLSRLMYGRYGIDQLGNFMMWAAVAMMIFGAVVRSSLIYTLALVLIVWADVRIMSKNHSKRYAENQKFLELKNRVVGFFRGGTRAFKDKEHCYFRCPSCHQQVRVPKGKGHIEIRCPKCGTKFIKNTCRVTVNTVPFKSLFTVMVPPCMSTIFFTIASPSPVPPVWVERDCSTR